MKDIEKKSEMNIARAYKKDNLVRFIIGVCFGFFIWAISSVITGETEPWDAKGSALYYYPLALFLSGFLGSYFYPINIMSTVVGIFAGQILFIFLFRFGPLWLIGSIMIALYSLIALLGSLFAKRFINYNKQEVSKK